MIPTIAKYIPAWVSPYLIRVGVWLQSLGRECYHQCPHEKQCIIHAKLEKTYGE